ncbi:NRT1/PTR family protein 2.2 [Melia azedarach]|uniref:NRT1/PTR family protein 2.2 n=1 Tax=Melia azedarach TaxID=155640 RepID=A0ACC1XIN0_MELAZ|nr:NRT1/PTR family protein 2.2 [Melia azedarach]
MAGDKKETISSRLSSAVRCFRKPEREKIPAQQKHRGWKTMPYILGNETCERLASTSLFLNILVYLVGTFHLDQVLAVNIINIWYGVTNFTPMFGAFICDVYAGRFKTIAFASFASLLGMVVLTLTAWLPQLHPQKCDQTKQPYVQCQGPNSTQFGFLLMGLGLMAVGTGGIRPCSIPFGVDQFDQTTQKGAKDIDSFFNWYYLSFTVVILITQTLVVYIQDSVSWVIGFGIPTVLMLFSILLFFLGTKVYVFVEPEGSAFSGIAQVFVAAYKKCRRKLPEGEYKHGIFYDPPPKGNGSIKLTLTDQFRFLNKAAMIVENEISPDGTPTNPWRLCSIQQVEEVKCLIRIIPIWATGIITFVPILVQSGTFTVSQAMKMDRYLGPNFQIPPGSITIIPMLTVGIWLPIYDRIIVPALRKITKHEAGITMLQRITIGVIFGILSVVVAGFVERERRNSAKLHPQSQLSVFWLVPQLALLGFAEAFNAIGQLEFFNKQFPDNMKSVGNAFVYCSSGIGSYLSSLLVTIIHKSTRKDGQPGWLSNDINAGRLDLFYFLIAGLTVLDFFCLLYCAHGYQYRYGGDHLVQQEQKSHPDLELAAASTGP